MLFHILARLLGLHATGGDVVVGGRRHLVLEGGMYLRPGHRGGLAPARLGMCVALAEKLRHPLTPMVYAIETLTPVGYRTATRMFAHVYPHRRLATPPHLHAIVRAVVQTRGLLTVDGDPWIVRYDDPATHTRKLRSSLVLDDLDVGFYLSINPDYRRGHILLAVAPLSFANLVASVRRLRHHLPGLVQRKPQGRRVAAARAGPRVSRALARGPRT